MSEMIKVPDGWEEGFLTDFIDVNPTVKIDKNLVYPFIEMDAVPFDGKKADYITYRLGSEAGMKFKYKDTLLARITPSAENGKSLYVLDNLNVGIGSTEFIVFRGKKLDSEFVFYLITSDFVRPKSIALMEGTSGRQRIPNNIYKDKIKIIIPKEKKEQEKIAKILSTLDKAIETTNRLIEKEKNIKKALMQELLTNGIDKDGHIRTRTTHTYKESELGLIPDEWEAGNIGLLVKNLDSKRIPLKEGDRQEIRGQYPYYGASGIIDWVDDFIFDGEYILLGEDGENVVSRVLPLAFKASGKIWVNNHAHVFQCKKDVNMDYVVNLLESTDYKSIINGSAQPKITQDGLNKLLFKIAPKNEQKQIAKILTTQDKKIETEETNLAKLGELKKGLMNDLLSGKVRVKI